MDGESPARKRGFVKRALLAAVAFTLFALTAETGLRLRQWRLHGVWAVPGWLRDRPTEVGIWHPFLRTIPGPSVAWLEVEGGRKAVVRTNSLGLRSDEVSENKPAGTFRVICVGASVVYDTRVGFEESWPNRLQALLRQRFPGRGIEVLNAGIPGRTSADSLVNVGLRLLALSPDVVIVLHGVNDQKPNRYPGFKPDYSHWYAKPKSAPVRQAIHQALNHSLLAAHVRYRLRDRLNPWRQDNWRGEPMVRYDEVTQPGLDAYRRNLQSIVAMCRMQGTQVVLATAGHSLDENADWNPGMGTRNPLVNYHDFLSLKGIIHGFREYNRVNREVAAALRCPLVDVEQRLPTGRQYFQDDVHFTAHGSGKVATLFADDVPWESWIEGGSGGKPDRLPALSTRHVSPH